MRTPLDTDEIFMLERQGLIRGGVFSALLASLPVASCVNNPREEPKASKPKSSEHMPASGVSSKVEVIQTSSCAAATGAGTQINADCRVRRSALADLDHDGVRDCIQWNRCGPDHPNALADGGLAYPRDELTAAQSGGTQQWVLYDSEQLAEAEHVEDFAVLRFGDADERVLARAVGYGSGNIQNWAIIDIAAGALRRWTVPPLPDSLESALASDEHLGKQDGRGVEVEAGQLEASWLVYRRGDRNCCPSGGVVKARLVPGHTGLRVTNVWREAKRSSHE
jgi:hypothetical protein